jgi:hypothetical protein
MKRWKIAGLIVLLLAAVLFALNFAIVRSSPSLPGGYNSLVRNVARMRRGEIGFWLSGEVVKTAVTDWSFIDATRNIQIQTHTWYLLPHVLTTDIVRVGDQLYLFSEYFPPARGKPDTRGDFPQARFWNRMVVRDPRIRVRIGNQLFDMRVYPLTDPSQVEAVKQAFLSKYDDVKGRDAAPEARRPALYFFHLEPQWSTD